MAKFDVIQNENGGSLNLELKGQIDEDTNFSLYDLSQATKLVMDLGEIKSINSCGIREWIKWLDGAQKAEVIEFHKCPKIIIDQINMVDGFLPAKAKVMSFFVPFYSEDSGDEKDILFTFGQEFDDSGVKSEEEITDSSGVTYEMDIIPAKYFKFLKQAG